MKTKSHALLGSYLIGSLQVPPARRQEKAFLFGCIEPDYNKLSYIKWSRRIQLLRGHNFINSEKCMRRIAEKLRKSERWGILQYYRLGKLIHYISDAFTYPHNEGFGKSIRAHREYEKRLQHFFDRRIALRQGSLDEYRGQPVAEAIGMIHRKYLEAAGGIFTDMRYILAAAVMAFHRLIPQSDAQSGHTLYGELARAAN